LHPIYNDFLSHFSGYKLRTKIAAGLKARSKAILTAIQEYNRCAAQLVPSRPPLEVNRVLEYVFLAEFDLLRDSRFQIQGHPWTRQGEREAMNKYFKGCRAREEITRLCIEARRLLTWLDIEERRLNSTLQELSEADNNLWHQVARHYDYKLQVHKRHRQYLQWMQHHSDWEGPTGPGKPLDNFDSIALRTIEPEMVTVATEELERDVEDEGELEDDAIDTQPVEFIWSIFET
jgi:hypothetical protein